MGTHKMSRIGCLPGRQPKRDIHAYTHPDWCQRGCLITIFRHACVLGCAQLHHISTQTLRHIHTYMHPQWGQRGCLVLSALLRFFVVVGLDCLRCTAAHVCMDVLRCTAWYAADAHHSCVHAPAFVTRHHLLPWIFLVCLDLLRCVTFVITQTMRTFIRTCTRNGASGGA